MYDAEELVSMLMDAQRYPTIHCGVNENGDERYWVELANPVEKLQGEESLHAALLAATCCLRADGHEHEHAAREIGTLTVTVHKCKWEPCGAMRWRCSECGVLTNTYSA